MSQKAKATPLMALMLAGTVVLSGCAPAQGTAPATPQQAAPAGSGAPIPITHIAYQDYLGTYAFTPEGMYCSQQVYPASKACFIWTRLPARSCFCVRPPTAAMIPKPAPPICP